MLNSRVKSFTPPQVEKMNIQDIPHNHFLCNAEDITFSEKFEEKNNSFGVINDPTIIANMFSICGKNANIPPKLSLVICAGFQNPKSKKGISGRHIIKRNHLSPFKNLYKKNDQWQVLVCVARNIFSGINNIGKKDQLAIAWAPEECAFVLVIDIGTSLGLHQHVLCTLYFHHDSLLMLGTLYTVPSTTAKLITNGNERYIPVPLNAPVAENKSPKKVKKWQIKNNSQTQTASLTNESLIIDVENDATYNKLTQQLSKTMIEDSDPDIFTDAYSYGQLIFENTVEPVMMGDDDFSNSIFHNINKYCQDIILMLNDDLDMLNDYRKKCSAHIDSLLKIKAEIEIFKTTIAKATLENPDDLANYFTTESVRLTLTIGKFIKDTDGLMREVCQIRNEQDLKILNKLMALQNKFVSCRLDDQIKKQWNAIDANYNLYLQTHKILVKTHDDTDNQMMLCICAMLRPICNFLSKAIKKTLNPSVHPAFIKLIMKNGVDEGLEGICKTMKNEELFNFFKVKFDDFFRVYPEIFFSIVQKSNTLSQNKFIF